MSSSTTVVAPPEHVASAQAPESAHDRHGETHRAQVHAWTIAVWIALITWFLVLFAIARSLYANFHMQRYDLGNMVQATWSTAHGRLLETTLGTGEQSSRLAAHVDPLLALLAPLWLVADSPLTLVAAQIAACALGAIPVLWLARRHLSETAAGLLSIAYLANPWLAWAALDAIHPATLAIPLLLLAIWFLDTDRLAPFALAGVLAASAGELMGLTIAAMGLWYWLARNHPRAGITIIGLGVLWTTVCLKIVIPHYSGAESRYYSLYSSIGGSPLGVLKTAVTDPISVVSELLTKDDVAYLVVLAAPFVGLFVLSPLLLGAAAPQLAASLLSSIGGHTDARLHTVSVLLPCLMATTIFGIARLSHARTTLAATVVLAVSVGMTLVFGPRTGEGATATGNWYDGAPPPGHVEAIRGAVALVPAEASVAATTKAGSHLSARRYIYSIPIFQEADWVVIDTWDTWVPVRPKGTDQPTWGSFNRRLVEGLVAVLDDSVKWRRVYGESGVFVFRRVGMTWPVSTGTAQRTVSRPSTIATPQRVSH